MDRKHRNSLAVGATILPIDSSQRGSSYHDQNSEPIEPGGRRRIVTSPYVVFRPTRFLLERPKLWLIHDVLIGRSSQFVSSDSVSGELMHLAELTWQTVQISQEVSIDVENQGPEPAHFIAALGGYYIDDWRGDALPPLPIEVIQGVNVQLGNHWENPEPSS